MRAAATIPAWRVPSDPPPGTATVADLDRLTRETGRVYEIVDGTLIAKAAGWYEDLHATRLACLLREQTRGRRLGWVCGGRGLLTLPNGGVRAADVTFVGKHQVPGGVFPGPSTGGPAYPELYPDLAVEVLSPSNTPGEMRRKREDFFAAGTRLVWQIDPEAGTCEVYTRPDEPDATVRADGTLDGGDVLPGVSIPLFDVLAAVELS